VHLFPQHILVTYAFAGPERRSDGKAGSDAFCGGPSVPVSFVAVGWSYGSGALEDPFFFSNVAAGV
jgi:hypothetical protein